MPHPNDRGRFDVAPVLVICLILLLLPALGGTGFFGFLSYRRARQAMEAERIAAAQAEKSHELVELLIERDQQRDATGTDPTVRELANETPTREGAPLRMISWNVESDGNDPAVIARQLVELGRYDIYALQEVHSRNIGRYGNAIREGISKSYRYFASNTGRNDRLMIIFDSDRLDMDASQDLFKHGQYRLKD